MSGFPGRRQTMKSVLIVGPPRLRFSPRSRPRHLPCSIILLRKNSILDTRLDKLTRAARYCGYRASMQAAISEPSLLLQDEGLLGSGLGSGAPPPSGLAGGGGATGAAGVLNVSADDQLLNSESDVWRARTRQ